MPDVVILTARFGYGHLSAANNIRQAFQEEFPDLSVEVVDPFQEVNPDYYARVQRLYRFASTRAPAAWYLFFLLTDRTRLGASWILANRKAAAFFRGFEDRFRPRLLITTYPELTSVLDRFQFAPAARACPVVSVVTDSITISRAWTRGHSDLMCVADPLSAQSLESMGVPAGRIRVTGFPTPPRFAELQPQPTIRDGRRLLTILYLPNFDPGHLRRILELLGPRPDIRIVLALGKREDLIREYQAMVPRLACELEVNGWIPDVCYRMFEADLVLTKAGGATVHEAIAAGCPVVITNVTPGQEEGNARLVEQMELGLAMWRRRDLPKVLNFLRGLDLETVDRLRRNVERVRRVDASRQIARLAAGLIR